LYAVERMALHGLGLHLKCRSLVWNFKIGDLADANKLVMRDIRIFGFNIDMMVKH